MRPQVPWAHPRTERGNPLRKLYRYDSTAEGSTTRSANLNCNTKAQTKVPEAIEYITLHTYRRGNRIRRYTTIGFQKWDRRQKGGVEHR